jgi:calcineurin-like phosphoesterase family protein
MAFVRKFYIADLHLMHERMLELQPRKFSNIEEHDETIVQRWNSVVRDGDIVKILGDVFMGLGPNSDRALWLFSRLKGKKHLITGNHDVDRDGNLHPVLAKMDWAEPPRAMEMTKDCGRPLFLCHYALRQWPGSKKGGVHFYGHSHGKLPGLGLSRDVGCDLPDVDFTPRTFEELTAGMTLPPLKTGS